jgi:superfamily II DNA or RNA helicase
MQLRSHQISAIAGFADRPSNMSSIIMTCGAGKSLIMDTICRQFNKRILVFRTIDLLRGFYSDYIKPYPAFNRNVLLVCSENICPINRSTTKKAHIAAFIKQPQFTVLITYTSYINRLVHITPSKPYDCIAFDEAHHVKTEHINKVTAKEYLFMTATPSPFLRQHTHVVYNYDMNQSILDGTTCDLEIYVVPYWFNIDVPYVHDDYISSISIACADMIHFLKCMKIISYHRYANSKNTGLDKTSVAEFKRIQKVFGCIACQQFIVDGELSANERARILRRFEAAACAIIHNCCSFGEGVNSPDIDCAIFMDTKYSQTAIIQAVGRTSRLTSNPNKVSRILIPVNMYGCADDLDAIDKGRWTGVHSILTALASVDRRVARLCRGEFSIDTKILIKHIMPHGDPVLYSASSLEIARLFKLRAPELICPSRPNQSQTREDTLENYQECVLSGETLSDILEAAHIKPYSNCKRDKMSEDDTNHQNNMILLTCELHRLFDKYKFAFDEHGYIEYDKTDVKLHTYLTKRCMNIEKPLKNFVDNPYYQWRRNEYRRRLNFKHQ